MNRAAQGLQSGHKILFFLLAYFWVLWMPVLAYLNGRGHKRKYTQGWRLIVYGHLLYLAILIVFTRFRVMPEVLLLNLFVIVYGFGAVLQGLLYLYVIFSGQMTTLTSWLDEHFNLTPAAPASE